MCDLLIYFYRPPGSRSRVRKTLVLDKSVIKVLTAYIITTYSNDAKPAAAAGGVLVSRDTRRTRIIRP